MQGILIFAHGARDPAWAEPFIRIRDGLRQSRPGIAIELAFLELMSPSLIETAEAMVAAGVDHMTVVPLFMAKGSHLKQDLPQLLKTFSENHPTVEVALTPAIGDVPELTAAIVDWVLKVSAPSS